MKKVIAVFARAPVAGRVKTRLARHLGDEAACALYAAMLRDTLELARRAARNLEACRVVVAHAPFDAFEAGEGSLSAFWSGARMAQCEGDIGARMLDCIARLQEPKEQEPKEQEQGGVQVVLIGSDTPDLPPASISRAFKILERSEMSFVSSRPQMQLHDLVFGPALDGGFYLIGAAKPVPPEVFRDVEWSTSETLAQVQANAQQLNLRLGFLARHGDLDTLADLRRFARQSSAQDFKNAPQTRHFLLSRDLFV